MKNLLKLQTIGFQKVGNWTLHDNALDYSIDISNKNINFLYAFVVDDEIKYIGKSTQTIYKRFQGYKKPGSSQRTNIKNNANLKEVLTQGQAVDIYIFIDTGLMRYREFHINLAAGLEDDLIKQIKPEWNN
jgi:hypothetical protein